MHSTPLTNSLILRFISLVNQVLVKSSGRSWSFQCVLSIKC